MRFIQYFLGILASICLIIAILIGSIEITAFADISFYEKEYNLLNVTETVSMNMEDLMEVTEEMLSYLQGKRDDLVVVTTMFGETREFFNEREKAHMADVRNLNLTAVTVMKVCIALSIVCFILLILTYRFLNGSHDKPLLHYICRSFQIGAGIFIAVVVICGLIVSANFNKYWRMFHTIFFTNDLWLLNPATDMLINIVPEGFFMDFVLRCAVTFVIALLILLFSVNAYLVLEKRKKRTVLTSVLIFCILASSFSMHNTVCYAAEGNDTLAEIEDRLNSIPVSGNWPAAPDISCDAAILIERNTGTVLYAKNALKSEYPASTTKIMTALLTLENGNLSDTVTFSKSAIYALTPGASHIGMTVGEELTVEDCLYGLLLPSANEVANALAEYISGSMSSFVTQMNTRAELLGCVNTHFANPNGLHDATHTTCAYDLAQIFMECLNTPNFIRIDSATTHVISSTNLVEENRPMKTTHKMLLSGDEYYNADVICGKTGHTDIAGGCLVTYAKRNGMELICVILNAVQPNQYTDTQALLNYGFEQFRLADAAAEDSSLFSAQGDTPFSVFGAATQDIRFSSFSEDTQLVVPSEMELSSLTHTFVRSDTNEISSVIYSIDGYALAAAPVKKAVGTTALSEKQIISSSNLQRMELPSPNYLMIAILLIGVLGAFIAVFCAIRSTPGRLMKRREKSTQVYKNVNLKKIKIK